MYLLLHSIDRCITYMTFTYFCLKMGTILYTVCKVDCVLASPIIIEDLNQYICESRKDLVAVLCQKY